MAQNKLVAELQQRIDLLEQWKREASLIIDPIIEYGQRHPDCKLGSSITSFVLERCKQYDDLKALYDQMDAETTKASIYATDAYERLHKRYEEVKGKAEKLLDVLEMISNAPVPANEREYISWVITTKNISGGAISEYEADKALQDWEEGQLSPKEYLACTVVAIAEEVSKDADTAKVYLESEGVNVKKLEKEGHFLRWLAKLYAMTFEKTGQRAKINHEEARKWYDSGATPEQCFRENWQSDGD